LKISKKIQRKLEARLKGYKIACEIAEKKKPGSSKGLRIPGSRNPRKQA